MERAGMVHALEKIHRLIKPTGQLIAIHPSTELPSIEIRLRDRFIAAGWLHETDDGIEYELADQALAAVMTSGLFALERSSTFGFLLYADTLADLQKYLAEEWKDAYIDDVTLMRAGELMSSIERDREVIVSETIRIARFARK
jgi:hypothetical protein